VWDLQSIWHESKQILIRKSDHKNPSVQYCQVRWTLFWKKNLILTGTSKKNSYIRYCQKRCMSSWRISQKNKSTLSGTLYIILTYTFWKKDIRYCQVCCTLFWRIIKKNEKMTQEVSVTVSNDNAPPRKFAKRKYSDLSVQIKIEPNFPFELVPRDTGTFELSICPHDFSLFFLMVVREVAISCHVTVSIEIATSPKPTKSRSSKSSIQIQIKPKIRFEFVLWDTEKSESLDLVRSCAERVSI